jgi:hypothetical protein
MPLDPYVVQAARNRRSVRCRPYLYNRPRRCEKVLHFTAAGASRGRCRRQVCALRANNIVDIFQEKK